MKRLTTDNPKDNIENARNLFYIKDQWTWVRSGGPAPDYADVSLCDFVRMLVKANIPDAKLPDNDDDLSMMMAEWLMDEPDTAEGIISLLYTAGWAFSELRHRLAAYEDTGLEPEQVKDMAENAETSLLTWFESRYGFPVGELMGLLEAKQSGRLAVLPCKVGDAVWIPGHKFCAEIERISIGGEDGLCFEWTEYDIGPELTEVWDEGYFTKKDIGKTVFLTREEAEEALRKEGEEVENCNTESV